MNFFLLKTVTSKLNCIQKGFLEEELAGRNRYYKATGDLKRKGHELLKDFVDQAYFLQVNFYEHTILFFGNLAFAIH